MKRSAPILAALVLAFPVAAFAAGERVEAGKDRCLVYGENCPELGDTITEKIGKLQSEIAHGKAVYTPEELGLLERKLEEYQALLDALLLGGSGGD